jgi:hypothetical protein
MRCKLHTTLESRAAMTDGTQVFSQIEQGSLSAAEQALPLVYDELHKLAANQNGTQIAGAGSSGDCLGPRGMCSPGGRGNSTALGLPGYFFGAAAEAMRRVLVVTAGRKQRLKAVIYDVAIVHSRL